MSNEATNKTEEQIQNEFNSEFNQMCSRYGIRASFVMFCEGTLFATGGDDDLCKVIEMAMKRLDH